MTNFKKSNLKTGMKIVTRDGTESIYIENPTLFHSHEETPGSIMVGIDGIGFEFMSEYDENLEQIEQDPDFANFDIMAVYAPEKDYALKSLVGKYEDVKWDCLWERNEKLEAKIEYKYDIALNCPRQSAIAHIVSADCEFSHFASELNKEYGIEKNIREYVQTTSPERIKGVVVPSGSVFSIVVKNYTYEKADLKALEEGIYTLCYLCTDNGFPMISFQKNDKAFQGYLWSDVEKIISEAFKNSDIKINIYYF